MKHFFALMLFLTMTSVSASEIVPGDYFCGDMVEPGVNVYITVLKNGEKPSISINQLEPIDYKCTWFCKGMQESLMPYSLELKSHKVYPGYDKYYFETLINGIETFARVQVGEDKVLVDIGHRAEYGTGALLNICHKKETPPELSFLSR